MRDFFKRHRAVHLWLLGALGLYAAYFLGISSRGAANAVSAATQVLKDACARFWYLFPFSVVEWFYAAFIAAVIALLAVLFHRVRTWRGRRLDGACGCVLSIACLFLTAGGLYCLLWGVNYYADGFQEKSGVYAQTEVSADELERVADLFAERLAELSGQVERDENGITRLSGGMYQTAADAKAAFDTLSQGYPVLAGQYAQPKPVFFSRMMSRAQITGVFFPLTFEANVNREAPEYTIPATMCHELSHLRGFMREDEANFIGYLACRQSESAEFQYSGVMLALVHSMNSLYSVDQDAFFALAQQYSPGVAMDFQYNNLYWQQFEGAVAEVSSKVNDSYLKANFQSDGVQSYGRMVDLLLADYRSRHGLE